MGNERAGVVKCPRCGTAIHPSHSGHVADHVTPGNRRCDATGLGWGLAVSMAAHKVSATSSEWTEWLRRLA